VCNTGKPRGLVETEYNKRRRQCEHAAAKLGLSALRDATIEALDDTRETLGETVHRRARHVVTENQRVLQGGEALRIGDLNTLGELLLAAHASLRDDYEVSCPELNAMIEVAAEAPGCFGARLMGAGFGGCAVAIVDATKADEFCATVEEQYTRRIGLPGTTFITRPSAGAEVVTRATG